MLALATALVHLEVNGLTGLNAAATVTLARLPALRRLGLGWANVTPRAEVLHALGQACPNISVDG